MPTDSYPKAILHVDGDAFFASCEITRKPYLRGKPVVTGLEKGIASSMTYEAKACGITRAMRLSEIRRVCPEVVILKSDYMLYAMYSQRMYAIVRRYTDVVEEYSIDECFADLTGMDMVLGISYEEIAHKIKFDLENDLGITFSVGLSVNKVLAKLASKWQKPAGFTMISKDKIPEFVSATPIHKLWGIGRMTSIEMRQKGIISASDLATKPIEWVRANFDKPVQEMHAELNGYFVHELSSSGQNEDSSSIQRTRTFHPASKDKRFLLSQLSEHVEHACATLRCSGRYAARFSFFIKTQQDFRYYGSDFRLIQPSATPSDFIKIVSSNIDKFFARNIEYRASGVRLFDLTYHKQDSFDLFGAQKSSDSFEKVFGAVDELSHRYGSGTMYLGSSVGSGGFTRPTLGKPAKSKKRLNMPILGSVR